MKLARPFSLASVAAVAVVVLSGCASTPAGPAPTPATPLFIPVAPPRVAIERPALPIERIPTGATAADVFKLYEESLGVCIGYSKQLETYYNTPEATWLSTYLTSRPGV